MPAYGTSAKAVAPHAYPPYHAPVGRYLLHELPKTLLRLLVSVVLFATVTQVRWPALLGHWVSLLAGALFAAAVLMICGSLLYNTLYYERYWRQSDSR